MQKMFFLITLFFFNYIFDEFTYCTGGSIRARERNTNRVFVLNSVNAIPLSSDFILETATAQERRVMQSQLIAISIFQQSNLTNVHNFS